MLKAVTYLLFVCLFFTGGMSVAQNENSKWYFGRHAGLDFMTNPPSPITTSTINTMASCASIASSLGNLLFYTDGDTIFDQTNSVMANGAGLTGNKSTAQGPVILKQPGSNTLYYVFTLGAGGTGTLSYSIVDMSLAGGNGSVTVKNSVLATGMGEKLTATRHCNGVDFWILTHDANSNGFLCFLLTSTGINSPPVITQYGAYYNSSDYLGQMKFSPDGKKIGQALYASNAFEIYDFDNSTGVVSNSILLYTGVILNYGCEFSPDGSKFYGSSRPGVIFQWDLCAGSATAIAASEYTIGTGNVAGLLYTAGSMQTGIDGKIYVATAIQNSLDVINTPNAAGSGCGYVSGMQSLATGTCVLGLPNLVKVYIQPPPNPFTYTVSSVFGCQGAAFHAFNPVNTATVCAAIGYSVTNILWNFGDPASGAANTSTLSNPVHHFSSTGSFTTQLVLYYTCGAHNDTLTEVVNILQPCISANQTSVNCASLGSATAVASNGLGSYSYTWMPTGQTGSVATGLSPGIYTLTVYDLIYNLTYTDTVALYSPVLLTGNTAYTSSITCNGASTGTAAIVNLAGGSGNQTYLWSNGTYTTASATPTTLNAGLWSVTVTDALTGCQINQQFYISQPPPVLVVVSANTPSVCSGNTIALNGTASGGIPSLISPGYTFSWTSGPSGTAQTVSPVLAGSYTYTLNAIDSLSCPGSQTIALNFIPNPTLAVSDVSICPLQTGTLSATGAASYTWNASVVGNTFTDSPLTDTQYTVTGEVLGCTSGTVANIILKPVPLPVLSNNSPVCESSVLSLSASGGVTYIWDGPNAFTSAASDVTLTPVALTANGVYNVTITAANSCTAAASQTIVINPLPTLTISPASSSICANTTSVVLIASGTATLFSWLPNQNVSSNNSATITAYPASTQIYSLTGSLNSCTVITTAIINVVPPPMPIASLNSPSTCAEAFNGSPNTITLTAGGASTYTISTPNDIYNSNPSGPITNLNTLPPHLPGASTATLYGSNGVCTLSTTVIFTIVPNPTISVSNPTPVICAGETFTYTNSGADSYTWSSGTPGQTLYTTGNVAVANPTTNAVFSVFGGSLGCNSPLQSTTITVNPLPLVYIQPLPAVMCLNSSITLTASGTGTSYSWQPPYWLNTDQGATVIADPVSQQSYTVISSLNSCTALALVTVSVLPLPDLSITSSSQNVLCLNQTFTLQGYGGTNYSWQYPNHLIVSAQAVQVIPTNISYSGTYTLTGTGLNDCSNTATLTMTIENNPSGYLQSDQLQGCVPLCGDYKFVASNFPQSEVTVTGWQINTETLSPQNSFHHCFTIPGDYSIKGNLISAHGCANTITLTITAYPQPEADFSYLPEKPVENFDRVSFTPFNDPTITSFNWYFINNDLHNRSANINPDYLFETAGAYPVALIVKNQWGCRDSIVKVVTVESDFAVYVPNAFTPNADGKNELFYPVTRGVQLLNFMIFDRWGERIFSTSEPGTGWDGTYKGQPCKEDVYVWKLEATSTDHENKKLNGFVTLLR